VKKISTPNDFPYVAPALKLKSLGLFASRIIREKLEEIVYLYKEVKKSKLSKKETKRISDIINRSLAKKYLELYEKSK